MVSFSKLQFLLACLALVFSSCGKQNTPHKQPVQNPAAPITPPPPPNQTGGPEEEEPPHGEPEPQDTPIFADGVGYPSSAQQFVVKLDWNVGPVSGDESQATFTFATAKRTMPKKVDAFTFKAWMPTMGHGAPTEDLKIEASADQVNVFTVKGIYFMMGGAWEVTVGAAVDDANDRLVIKLELP